MAGRNDDLLSSSQYVEPADAYVGLHPSAWPSSGAVGVQCIVPGGMGSAVEVVVRSAGQESTLGGKLDANEFEPTAIAGASDLEQ